MNNKLKSLLFIALFLSLNIYSQEIDSKKFINKIHKEYVEKLELNTKQSTDFKKVLKKYNSEIKKLIAKKSKTSEINKMIKLNDLAIYKILTRVQFAQYKTLKSKLEPLKKYRFET
jgi:polyhydroxyalkanoate synthesis regulator phasin